MSTAAIRILLADDHAIVRAGVRRLLEQKPGIVVVAEADSGEQAYQLYGEHRPDAAVLDLTMPGMGGLEAMRRILARHDDARLLVYSMHESAAYATQALRAGARGYVCKTGEPEELISAVQEIARGKTYLSPSVAQTLAMHNLSGGEDPVILLSSREFAVFRLLAEGRSADEIGEVLKISQKTVANYQTLVKQKLGVSNPVELIRLAIRHGMVEG